jgi:hypothetical protein
MVTRILTDAMMGAGHALHGAALFGYDDVIKHLMAHNANISRPNQ